MSIERAQLLAQQRRPEQALQELQPALAEDPNEPLVHVLMAECLTALERYPEAGEHAERAVYLEPDWDYPQFILGRVLFASGKPKPALQHAEEAVRLDPEAPANHGLVAAIHCDLSNWRQAAAAAETGLAMDPDHESCLNTRAIALMKLGKHEAAEETIRSSLSRNPENPTTHANLGWELLHTGKPTEALHHYREALRLDPKSSWARAGLIEALKAQNPVYGIMLRYFLWMSSFPPRVQIALVIGAIVGISVMRRLMSGMPALAPFVGWVSLAYVAFVMMTWMAQPCFDLLLRLHPIGKHALFQTQRRAATCFGLGVLASTGVLAAHILRYGAPRIVWVYVLPFFFLFPLTIASHARPVWPLVGAAAYTLGTFVLLVGGFLFLVPEWSLHYVYASVIATWLGNIVPRTKLDEFG